MRHETAPAEPLMDVRQLEEAAKNNSPEVIPQLQKRLDRAFGEGLVTVTKFEFIPAQRALVVQFSLGNGHHGEIVYGE